MDSDTLFKTGVENKDDFVTLQRADPAVVELLDQAVSEPVPVGRSYYYLSNDLLMHHQVDHLHKKEYEQLVVPKSVRARILNVAHDIPATAHLSFGKTKNRLIPHFLWLKVLKSVHYYCKSCDVCQRLGKGPNPAVAELISLPVISEPYRRIAIDVCPLPECKETGNRFILTVFDLASHYPEPIPLKDHTAKTIATALVSVFSHFGFPEESHSDRGTEFMSELMQIVCNEFSIRQIRTTPYRPQTNGSIECFHRTLKSTIKSLLLHSADSWDTLLPCVLFSYREVPVDPIGFSPF
jgi:hypothetical protein